jgi:hypothetical protein
LSHYRFKVGSSPENTRCGPAVYLRKDWQQARPEKSEFIVIGVDRGAEENLRLMLIERIDGISYRVDVPSYGHFYTYSHGITEEMWFQAVTRLPCPLSG